MRVASSALFADTPLHEECVITVREEATGDVGITLDTSCCCLFSGQIARNQCTQASRINGVSSD